MKEFKKRGLEVKYKKKIEEWFVYLDQIKFGKKLEKQILKEVDRYMATKKSVDQMIDEMSEEPEWVIEIEEELIEKYPEFKSVNNLVLNYA